MSLAAEPTRRRPLSPRSSRGHLSSGRAAVDGPANRRTADLSVNPPFLESRLASISEPELQARFHPARAQIIAIDSLEKRRAG